MKNIILVIFTIICFNITLGLSQGKNQNIEKVKINFPDLKYRKKVEKNFYEKIWIGKTLYKDTGMEFNPNNQGTFDYTPQDVGSKYKTINPKLFRFKYVPLYRVKPDASTIREGQAEYDIFELDSLDQLFLIQYKGEFVGFVNIYSWKPTSPEVLITTPKSGLNLQQDTIVKASNSIYSEYKKQGGRVFNVRGLGTKWFSIDKDNRVWTYYPYENKHLTTAYKFINEKTNEIKKLAKGIYPLWN